MPGRQGIGLRCAVAMLAQGLLAAVPMASSVAQSPDTPSARWFDMESRIQYAYYTEDARTLANLQQMLTGEEAQTAQRFYYLALASYRLAQLRLAPSQHGEAGRSADICVDQLNQAMRLQEDSAEALALQSGCLALLAQVHSIRAPLLVSRSASQMRRAVTLAPRNPRVLLLEAQGELARDARTASGLDHLQQAIAAFEHERQQTERVPGWGAADAYATLGRSYLDRGDAIAARAALEHALLLVPDFTYAHRLMARITSG